MPQVRRHLTSRSEHLGRCRPRQLKEQLRWMAICEERAEAEGRELSIGLGLRALRDFYGGVVTASKDDAPAAVQAAIHNVAGLGSSSIGGGLIQTTSG